MKNFSDFVSGISVLVGLLISCGAFKSDQKALAFTLICVFAFLAVVLIMKVAQRRNKRNLTSSQIVNMECNRICKYISRILKANGRQLDKYVALTDNQKKSIRTLRTVKLMKKHKTINNENVQNIKHNNKAKYNNSIKSDIKKIDITNYRIQEKIASNIIENIKDMNRLLLMTEQYECRIDFGKYIAKYGFDQISKSVAKIDYIGWSNILLGKTKAAQQIILEAIDELNIEIDRGFGTEEYRYAIIRAYRHLGSDYNLYTKKPFKALEYLNIAMELLKKEDSNKPKYIEMLSGCEYGVAIAYYNLYTKQIKSYIKDDSGDNFLKKAYDIVVKNIPISHSFANQHRYLKYLILENSIICEIRKLDKREIENLDLNSIVDCSKIIKDNYKFIEAQIGTTIYSDEAIIYYLEQKLDNFNNSIEEIIRRSNENSSY